MLQVDEKLVSLVQDIVISYETQISTTGMLIDNTYEMLQESEKALEKINNQLREKLADNASLRKKDFDSIMEDIQSQRRERHREIKRVLNEFVHVHKEAASQLKVLLDDAKSGGMADFRTVLNRIQTRRDYIEREVMNRLRDFQNEQEEIIAEVHRLSNDTEPVKVKDFKTALSNLAAKQKAIVST